MRTRGTRRRGPAGEDGLSAEGAKPSGRVEPPVQQCSAMTRYSTTRKRLYTIRGDQRASFLQNRLLLPLDNSVHDFNSVPAFRSPTTKIPRGCMCAFHRRHLDSRGQDIAGTTSHETGGELARVPCAITAASSTAKSTSITPFSLPFSSLTTQPFAQW